MRRSPPRTRSRLPLVAAAALVATVVVAVFVAGWFDRSETLVRGLGSPARVVVVNQAGPLEVVEGPGPAQVRASTSYLLQGPVLDVADGGGAAVVRAGCPGWAPCRVALRLRVPPGTAVEAVAVGGVVHVGPFSGPLAVTADEGGVSLGPVTGPLTVVAGGGSVRATDVRSETATIRAVSGPVELVLRTTPASLTVEGDRAPVAITVPPAAYRLDLRGEPVVVEGLDPVRRRNRVIAVDTAGPVTVRAGSDDGD